MNDYIKHRAIRYATIAAHGAMSAVKAYEPNVDIKLQAAADKAYTALHDIINQLYELEEAYRDKATEEEGRAYSEA